MIPIRRARDSDLPAITEIYNEAILTTTATFDTEPKDVEERRRWLAQHDARHPVLVAELGGKVVGWASLSLWSDRCAYADTAENSVYVASASRGKGVGRALLEATLESARAAGLHTIVSRVAGESEASIRLHESLGFERIGTMREVGRKFGRLLDVHLLQIVL